MGTLFIVATPIGNLQDISIRCAKTLLSVPYILCEDTRRTGLLLKYIQEVLLMGNTVKPRLISYFEQNEPRRIPMIIQILKKGESVALVSDAGTPTLSDPGFKLVRECVREGIKIESIPGPSSIISSLVISGLPTDKFLFIGYPPKKEGKKISFFKKLHSLKHNINITIVMFEAPHRLIKTLEVMKNEFGNAELVILRELTKIHEEIIRKDILASIEHFKNLKPKGEFVIIFSL